MNSFRTLLTALETSVSKYASQPVFKIPRLNPSSGKVQEWESITYAQFKNDIEEFAKYWTHVLRTQGLPQGSVVGLWIGGMTYIDVLHIYGVSRAGYIPQMFSLRLPSAPVIFELLQKADAKALIYDSSYQYHLGDSPVPIHLAVNPKDKDVVYEFLPDMREIVNREDTAFIFHTSGSTSNSPKLIPWSYSFVSANIYKCLQVFQVKPGKSCVKTWLGSACHAGQHLQLMAVIPVGSCIIQPTNIPFSPDELEDMVERCGLSTLSQVPTFLAAHIKRARQDPKFLSLLRGLDEVVYGGLALPRNDEDWAYKSGINLKSVFASTECGAMMFSVGSQDARGPLLRTTDIVAYDFHPVVPETKSESGDHTSSRLLELVVLSSSPDCPHRSFCDADGRFHTGDLFEEVMPGLYLIRGRDDDWVKSENALRCDTRAIEDNVRATCATLIRDCVVVGHGRPSPTLVVEAPVDIDHEKLKKDIIRATHPFNSRRYMHERISSEKMIIVVPLNTLPRTPAKDNIRRKAVEEAYKSQLDEIYGTV